LRVISHNPLDITKYFNIVEGDSDELKQTLRKLANATQSHITRVREALDSYKKTLQ
jgi:hypothetical protein